MIGGFALVAFPAKHGDTGIMTFIVSYDGVVYEKDLGPTTTSMASAMKAFNPDRTWRKVDAVTRRTARSNPGETRREEVPAETGRECHRITNVSLT